MSFIHLNIISCVSKIRIGGNYSMHRIYNNNHHQSLSPIGEANYMNQKMQYVLSKTNFQLRYIKINDVKRKGSLHSP
jgi:hypothetical protein